MDDPTPRSKKDRETECVYGALVPKRGPLSFSGSSETVANRSCSRSRHTFCIHLNLRNRSHRFHPPQHRNPRLPEHVLDFGFL